MGALYSVERCLPLHGCECENEGGFGLSVANMILVDDEDGATQACIRQCSPEKGVAEAHCHVPICTPMEMLQRDDFYESLHALESHPPAPCLEQAAAPLRMNFETVLKADEFIRNVRAELWKHKAVLKPADLSKIEDAIGVRQIGDPCNSDKERGEQVECADAVETAHDENYANNSKRVKISPDGTRYEGEFLDDQRHGQGLLVQTNGYRYIGTFAKSRFHGYGTFTAKNGNTYDGWWSHDLMHGYGHYKNDKEGSSYEGEWANGEKAGKGIENCANGDEFHGSYLRNCKQGEGVYTKKNGVVFIGQFDNDRIHGKGRYNFADKRSYVGEFVGGHMHGEGKMTWASGSSYEGQYVHDMKHGEGTFHYPDGKSYRGQWANGKPHGFGTVSTPEGLMTDNEWREGQLVNP